MSHIEQLVKQYCPNGVEYKRIDELCIVKTGGDTPQNCIKGQKEPSAEHPYPVYSNGTETYGYADSYRIDRDAVSISSIGNVGYVAYREAFFTPIIRLKVLLPNSEILKTKYLYYALTAITFVGTNSSLSSMKADDVKKYRIPVPPLPVQEEIVKILDAFTSLEAELEAELEARKKQYEYYRNQLLNPENMNGEVRYFTIEEAFDLKNGYTPSKNNPAFWENGTIPWFRMEDIRKNGRMLNDALQHITKEAVRGGKLFPANSILLATTATIGEHCLISVPYLANQQLTCLSLKNNNLMNIKYFYYYMFLLDEWCKNNTNVSGFASVDMSKFRKLKIPVPSLAEQERIVAILDKFDSLVNDISEGLPAEINARKQQYEHYRNKLLTFDEAA